jgi:KDO2-lipid IV(A) lauroyltransferase
MARRAGEGMFLVLPARRRVAFGNLTIAFGNSKSDFEKTKIVLESFRNLATSLMELFRIPRFIKVASRHMRLRHDERLDGAYARGKGFVLAMSHLGPWEYMGVFSYLKKYNAAIIGRALRNPYIYRWVKSMREAVRLDYIDKDAGLRAILSRIRRNYGIAMAIDQWAGNDGIWIDFFGTPTSTTSFPARLAKKTGCPLFLAHCVRIAAGEYEIHVEPEMSPEGAGDNWVEDTTKKLNLLLEEKIRAYPGQWTWMHKRWKGKK